MKLLKNFDVFKEYFNLDTKEFCSFEQLQKTVGIYKTLDGIMTGLLVEDTNLYFLYGEEKFLITDSYKVLLKKISKAESEIALSVGNEELVKFLYPIPNLELNVTPFEYIDEEDFKWGEFIEKIVNDKERRRNFVAKLSEKW